MRTQGWCAVFVLTEVLSDLTLHKVSDLSLKSNLSHEQHDIHPMAQSSHHYGWCQDI